MIGCLEASVNLTANILEKVLPVENPKRHNTQARVSHDEIDVDHGVQVGVSDIATVAQVIRRELGLKTFSSSPSLMINPSFQQ